MPYDVPINLCMKDTRTNIDVEKGKQQETGCVCCAIKVMYAYFKKGKMLGPELALS